MDGAQELKSLDPANPLGVVGDSKLEAQLSCDRDRDELARLGKTQVLKVGRSWLSETSPSFLLSLRLPQRNFATASMIGFSCIVMATWEGQLVYSGSYPTSPPNT